MVLPIRISARRTRPAVGLLVVGCLVSFSLGQQLGFAFRSRELQLHTSTIPTAHAAGQLSGRLSAPSGPSGPSGQPTRPVVTTSAPSHTVASTVTKQDAASHGKKDNHDGQGQKKQDGHDKHDGQQGGPTPTGQASDGTHPNGGDGHGNSSDA